MSEQGKEGQGKEEGKEKDNSIELSEIVPEPAKEKPAEADVKEELTGPEIEMAKKHDLLKKEGEDAGEGKGKEEGKEGKEGKEDKEGKQSQGKKESKGSGKVEDKSPEEKEHEMLNNFSKNEQGLYWKQKKEKQKRQQAEIDRDMFAIKLKHSEKELEKARETKKPEENPDNIDDLFDEDGKKKEKKENILTVEKHKEIEDKESKEKEEQDQKHNAIRQQVIEQGEEAKLEHDDFDQVMDLTTDIMSNHEKIFEDQPKKIMKVRRLYKDWIMAVANALDPKQEENAADIAYELGQMHPKYGVGNGKNAKNEDGTKMSSEKVERMLDNAGKRPASASVTGGGGRRLVSYEDLTIADLAKMPKAKFAAIPKEVRDRVMFNDT